MQLYLILFSILIALFLLYVASRPNHFRVERSITIQAAPEKIFPLINDFHRWEPWSPWEKVDPQVRRTYSGSQEGKGAVYEWHGNNKIGQGRMEIIDSRPFSTVVIKIDFISPFAAHNTVEFTLQTRGTQTLLTQAMYGPSTFPSKLMGMICSMDKMIGTKYEEGLASLKTLAEQAV